MRRPHRFVSPTADAERPTGGVRLSSRLLDARASLSRRRGRSPLGFGEDAVPSRRGARRRLRDVRFSRPPSDRGAGARRRETRESRSVRGGRGAEPARTRAERDERRGAGMRSSSGDRRRTALAIFACCLLAVSAQQHREDGPKFLSRGQTYRAVIGDTLLLPCQVQNLGSLVLLWRRGAAVLTAASLMVVRDDRFRLVDGYNLQITQVGPQDAGDYVCQISDRESRDQIHTVEILVPASVRATPESLRATARKGGAAALECRAAGNPVPAVTWIRLNDSARVGEGQQLVMEQVTRRTAGDYRCVVDNGVGSKLQKDFKLQILFPPEISVERSWVHSGEGFRAELVCTVEADPPAEVSWYQDSFPIAPSERMAMTSHRQNHSLLIANVQPEDFGNYSCSADNPLGRSRQHVEVSGRPGPASFHSPPLSRSPHAYNLSFELDSYPPLDELRVLYRQLMVNESFQQPGRWHDVSLAGRLGAQGSLSHRVVHELRGLRAGAVYEVIVQAKNRYGWNEVSDIFQFHTRGAAEVRAAEGGAPPPFGAAAPDLAPSKFLAATAAILLYSSSPEGR